VRPVEESVLDRRLGRVIEPEETRIEARIGEGQWKPGR